jgi:putative cardiolipin synthase
MGFLIDSPEIATALSRTLDRTETFYALSTGPDDANVWTGTTADGQTISFDREPNTTAFQRGMVTFMSWLPVEWIL